MGLTRQAPAAAPGLSDDRLQAALCLQSSVPLEGTAPPLGDSPLVPAACLTTTKWRRDHASAVSLLKTRVQIRVDTAAVLWLLALPAQSHTEMLTDHRGALQGGCGPCPANAGLFLSVPSSCGGARVPSPLDTRPPPPPASVHLISSHPP